MCIHLRDISYHSKQKSLMTYHCMGDMSTKYPNVYAKAPKPHSTKSTENKKYQSNILWSTGVILFLFLFQNSSSFIYCHTHYVIVTPFHRLHYFIKNINSNDLLQLIYYSKEKSNKYPSDFIS